MHVFIRWCRQKLNNFHHSSSSSHRRHSPLDNTSRRLETMSPRDIERQDPESIENGNDTDSDDIPEEELRATPEMCHYCFDLLVTELQPSFHGTTANHTTDGNSNGEMRKQASFVETLPPSASCPLFVTWDKRRRPLTAHSSGEEEELFDLRGCIGTLAPRPLHTAVKEYALTSAFRDRRFNPIDWTEVPELRVAVSLLVKYEACSHCHDWVVGTHGIIIKFVVNNTHYNATYLPEVALEQG